MKLLIKTKGKIDRSYDRKHITYEWMLKKDYRKIMISFEYAPKYIDNDEKTKEIIYDVIDKHVIGEQKDIEKKQWEKYKDLKNLLTISIDDKNGFRGCAHRQNQKQKHIISEAEASPGFIKGIFEKGIFKFIISVHALVTDECNYEIKVYDMEEENDEMDAI